MSCNVPHGQKAYSKNKILHVGMVMVWRRHIVTNRLYFYLFLRDAT